MKQNNDGTNKKLVEIVVEGDIDHMNRTYSKAEFRIGSKTISNWPNRPQLDYSLSACAAYVAETLSQLENKPRVELKLKGNFHNDDILPAIVELYNSMRTA